jgi:transcription antitermination protein NusB
MTTKTTQGAAPGARRRSRELALQLLFQTEFLPDGFEPDHALSHFRKFIQDFQIDGETSEYGGQLFLGVASRMKEIDGIIQAHSSHWKTSRMGLVDLSVMRVAVFEMKFLEPAIPPSVAINEAVEIAKTFGSTESSAFVNGILDHVARGL